MTCNGSTISAAQPTIAAARARIFSFPSMSAETLTATTNPERRHVSTRRVVLHLKIGPGCRQSPRHLCEKDPRSARRSMLRITPSLACLPTRLSAWLLHAKTLLRGHHNFVVITTSWSSLLRGQHSLATNIAELPTLLCDQHYCSPWDCVEHVLARLYGHMLYISMCIDMC